MSGRPRLSLVASFDDITRNSRVLTLGIESEFLRFAKNQESCREQWYQIESETSGYRDKIAELDKEIHSLHTKLKHARNQIDQEMKRRTKVEQERDSLERQIMLVRELLASKNDGNVFNDQDKEKLAFLSTCQMPSRMESPRKSLDVIEESYSILSPSDISYDKTEEDLDASRLRSGRKYYKRPSAPPLEEESPIVTLGEKRRKSRSKKHHRRSRSAVVATTTVTVTDSDKELKGFRKKRKSSPIKGDHHKRHHSEQIVDSDTDSFYGKGSTHLMPPVRSSSPSTPNGTSPTLRHYSSAGKGLNRPHVFVSKTVIRPETCIPCGKRIKFGKIAMKCKDCRATAHPECKEQVPLPCIVTSQTPGTAKNAPCVLSDYCPLDPPMIPALIIHSVNEVEARGLSEEGIYRVPGSEREVKDLKEKFLRGKGTPSLANINDIHVVCGCVKDFLRGLKEPLVTYGLWGNFVAAAECPDYDESESALYQAVSQLPQPNRDTLAFMILHLQRVGECHENKMSSTNLAKVFGPTLVRYSCEEPEPMQMINETKKQHMVMEKLIAISADYWTNFITIDDNREYHMSPQTPEMRFYSMLGPVGTPRDSAEKKSWMTPRFGSKSKRTSKKPTHFFSSPSLT